MFGLLLFGFVAGALAAPQFGYHNYGRRFGPPPFYPDYRNMPAQYHAQGPLMEDVFDTNKFWADMSRELREIDNMLADLTRNFASSSSQVTIEGNEYKITIPLADYEERDIVVKAREGLVMIQACHEYPGGSQKNYLDMRTLPENVSANGTWVYEKSILKIVFPLKESAVTEPTNVVESDVTTKSPSFDREDIEETNGNEINGNADVGLDRGDLGKETELLTNLIPDKDAVEATTYAVDLKDEVEFVPIRF